MRDTKTHLPTTFQTNHFYIRTSDVHGSVTHNVHVHETHIQLIGAAELWLTHVRPATTMTDCKAEGEKWSTMAPERVIIVVCELHRLCMQSPKRGPSLSGLWPQQNGWYQHVTVQGPWSTCQQQFTDNTWNFHIFVTPFLTLCSGICALELEAKINVSFLGLSSFYILFGLKFVQYISKQREEIEWSHIHSYLWSVCVFDHVKFHLVKHSCTPICRVKETVTVMLVLPKILYSHLLLIFWIFVKIFRCCSTATRKFRRMQHWNRL